MLYCQPYSKDTKQIRISTDLSDGFFIDMQLIDCDSLRKQSFFVSTSDTTLSISSVSENSMITIINQSKTASTSIPLYLEGDKDVTFTLEQLKSASVEGTKSTLLGSEASKTFSEIWNKLFVFAFKKDENPSKELIEELKEHKRNYPANLMASFMLLQLDTSWQQSNEEIQQIENCQGLSVLFKKLEKFNNGKTLAISDSYNQFISDLDSNVIPLNTIEFDSFEHIEKGKIFFWASWCSPCIKEFHKMAKEEFQDPNNYFISVDKNKENVIEIAKRYNIKKVFITDSEWLRKYGIKSIPTHLEVNKNEKKIAITH